MHISATIPARKGPDNFREYLDLIYFQIIFHIKSIFFKCSKHYYYYYYINPVIDMCNQIGCFFTRLIVFGFNHRKYNFLVLFNLISTYLSCINKSFNSL
jgi:hypothetical protein